MGAINFLRSLSSKEWFPKLPRMFDWLSMFNKFLLYIHKKFPNFFPTRRLLVLMGFGVFLQIVSLAVGTTTSIAVAESMITLLPKRRAQLARVALDAIRVASPKTLRFFGSIIRRILPSGLTSKL